MAGIIKEKVAAATGSSSGRYTTVKDNPLYKLYPVNKPSKVINLDTFEAMVKLKEERDKLIEIATDLQYRHDSIEPYVTEAWKQKNPESYAIKLSYITGLKQEMLAVDEKLKELNAEAVKYKMAELWPTKVPRFVLEDETPTPDPEPYSLDPTLLVNALDQSDFVSSNESVIREEGIKAAAQRAEMINAQVATERLLEKISKDLAIANSNPRTLQFEQNNYSPKELTAAEIYQQTQNQLALAKGALS